jgi:soluble lytic murein transglycosylase-like protein
MSAAIALLVLTASFARAEGVQVYFRYAEKAAQQTRPRLSASEDILARLLLAPLTIQQQRAPGTDRIERRYVSEGWKQGLSPQAKDAGLSRLRVLWSQDVSILESAAAAPADRRSPEDKKGRQGHGSGIDSELGAMRDAVSGRFSAALGMEGGTFFDGTRLASVHTVSGEAFPGSGQQPGLSSSALRRTASVLDKGGLHIAEIPSPKEKAASGPYADVIQAEAKAANIDAGVFRAFIEAKGGFSAHPGRVSGNSHGLLLITAAAAKRVGMAGQDQKDSEINLRTGARLLAALLARFDGNVHRALAAYQVGESKVLRSGGIPADPEVRAFLAAYELAYRQGPEKPAVKPVPIPKEPVVLRVAEKVQGKTRDLKKWVAGKKDRVLKYRPMIQRAGSRHDFDPILLEAMMRAENPWGDPYRVSDAGAVGLMQFMPDTADDLGIDPNDPEESVNGAARHMKYLLRRVGQNIVLAVAAYNAGDEPVRRLKRIPNYPETKGYVKRVFAIYEDLGGEDVNYAAYMPPKSSRRTASRNRRRHRR